MKRKSWIFYVVLVSVMMGNFGLLWADEVDDLRAELQAVQGRLAMLEANQSSHQNEVNSRLDAIAASQPGGELPSFLDWVESIELGGDFRYRHELIDSENNGVNRTGRNRHRIRARLTLDAQVNDQADIHVRIATGSADPVSTNTTLDGAFSSKSIWLDRAYFDWHPDWLGGVSIWGGKVANPFRCVGGSQLIWDGDLNPEGLAGTYSFDLSEADRLSIVGGGFWVDEVSGGSDSSLWGIQADLRHEFTDDTYALGGVSYYNYGNVLHRNTLFDATDSFGNTTENIGGANVYANDYDLVEFYGAVGTRVLEMPFTVFGDLVTNAAASGSDMGWLVGFTINKAKVPGSWQFGYNYREVQADAVIGALCDSDFIGGGTDGSGHVLSFKYQVASNMQAALTYFCNELGNDDDYRRMQADFIFKF
ncbi:MAG: putative porin [Sedimentisphaerales bacterium]|nr:putative porin [Sedimentisphaerales bacterium]